jgi:hypothetical protein
MPDSETLVQPEPERMNETLHYIMEDYVDDILAESGTQHI